MRICRNLLGLVLLFGLNACLDYEIRIETVVAEDGTSHRVVRLREKSKDHKTWRSYEAATAPFKVIGSHEKGFVMEAKLPAGVHAGGLRVRESELESKPTKEDPPDSPMSQAPAISRT